MQISGQPIIVDNPESQKSLKEIISKLESSQSNQNLSSGNINSQQGNQFQNIEQGTNFLFSNQPNSNSSEVQNTGDLSQNLNQFFNQALNQN